MAAWLVRAGGHGEIWEKFLSDKEVVDGNPRIREQADQAYERMLQNLDKQQERP